MTSQPADRPRPRDAGPELLALARWEAFCEWFLPHTARWPRSCRFTLVRRLQDHALDVAEWLVVARYEPAQRAELLRRANLHLERMRHLLRLARSLGHGSSRAAERAHGEIDEVGRMLFGWRRSLGEPHRVPADRRAAELPR
ncbi:four helix bundle protein [Engelhardtia mirabilis]|uniref:bAvd-like domain-containing protein n=1 Tax=Engelhardtia mirabilis TaxID=2528011 RepID=A0A518BRC8_9BACT|nr:hypothetical protein Pla133_46550 [Planctomycetes bacterium Pla133]QDV03861.1 hypothetical protein Pla86_46530 [Planctomycetes bacterium Pla86]